MINNKIIGIEYPRFSNVEIQDYIIKCNKISYLRVQFVKDLTIEILKEKPSNIDKEEIFLLIEDILRYFENYKSEGIKDLFRGYVVKVQKGISFSSKSM